MMRGRICSECSPRKRSSAAIFRSKGFEHKLFHEIRIEQIPVMWLVDNPAGSRYRRTENLMEKVEKLLAED